MGSDPNQVDPHIESLLHLLNASEDGGAPSPISAATIDEVEPPEADHLTSLKRLANVAHQLSAGARSPTPLEHRPIAGHIDPESAEDHPENRFAAHIVHGMSKLISGMSKLKRE